MTTKAGTIPSKPTPLTAEDREAIRVLKHHRANYLDEREHDFLDQISLAGQVTFPQRQWFERIWADVMENGRAPID